ncbi:hypothetical protein Scep_022957 [Stephania cephalantha]|uniref:Pentatricopeptide repeat-containing protein n=1 Tax=Stephania cephalantha TaxID=152367 RepID=A0AAP0FBW6_9MAGN
MERSKKRSIGSSSSPPPKKRPTFISYREIPKLHPKIKLLCEILANTPSLTVESTLDEAGVRVATEDVEEVLKLSYSSPGPTVKFFTWAGRQLSDKLSPYAWNLLVDLLGKNSLFDAMWDAIKSMKKEGLVSLATFASVFSSYVGCDRIDEALMAFDVMDQYGLRRDVAALNSLLSAICREGKTGRAKAFFDIVKDRIRADADSYAILLEGWENEGDAMNAHNVFAEMVASQGWDPSNVPAYDAFLIALLKGPNGVREAMSFFATMKEKRCYPGSKFLRCALEEFARLNLDREGDYLWEALVESKRCNADTKMYNAMIRLQCHSNNADRANKLLDDMIVNGAFPDSGTYNAVLQLFLKLRKLRDASAIFREMVKNEFVPSVSNCKSAIKVYLDVGEPEMAIRVWKCLVESESDVVALEDTANFLIVELRELNRLPEACKYADEMIDRKIKLSSKTLSQLKHSLTKLGKMHVYDELLKKWKSR